MKITPDIEVYVENCRNTKSNYISKDSKPKSRVEIQAEEIILLKSQIQEINKQHEEQLKMFFRRVDCSLQVGAFNPNVSGWSWQFPNTPTSLDEVVENVKLLKNEYCRVRDLRNALIVESDDVVEQLESIARKIEELKSVAQNTFRDIKDR